MNTVEINYGGDRYHFSDDYCEGDIITITCSDYCYELITTEEQLVALGVAIIEEEIEGVVLWSDENIPFLFANDDAEEVIIDMGIDNYGVCKRPDGIAAIYE